MTNKYEKALEGFLYDANLALKAGFPFWDDPKNDGIKQALELAVFLENNKNTWVLKIGNMIRAFEKDEKIVLRNGRLDTAYELGYIAGFEKHKKLLREILERLER